MTSANTNEVTQVEPLVDSVPEVAGKPGHPRRRPEALYADRGYDSDAKRKAMRQRGIQPFFGRRGEPHGSGMGKIRWVVERTNAWLAQFRRLRMRYARRADIQEAFLLLACVLICWNFMVCQLC